MSDASTNVGVGSPLQGGVPPGEAPANTTDETPIPGEGEDFIDRLVAGFKPHGETPAPGDVQGEGEGQDEGGEGVGSAPEGEGDEVTPGAVPEGAPSSTPEGDPSPQTPQPDPQAPPATPSTTPPAPDPSSTTEPPTPPAPEPITINGRTFAPEEANGLVQVYDWAQRLDPNDIAVMEAALSGNYVLVPRDQYQPPNQQGTSTQPPPDPDSLDESEYAELPPAVQQELADLRNQVQGITQHSAAQHREQVLTALSTGRDTFAQSMNLTPEQAADLERRVAQQGILPGITRLHGNDFSAAMQAAMETVYWATPEYREQALQAQTEAQVAAERERQKAEAKRTSKASALTGSAGSVPRTTPPATKADRHAAMVGEVADAMSGGQRES